MNVKQLNKTNLPIVRLDKSLDKYKGKVLFKDKLEKANDTLKKVGIPQTKKQAK